ncbi:MAG: cell division protein ZapE [Microthrixaceae bacterium]|nr:cell division protein ZapE [Microthrixaceae bacterium]
MGTPRLVDRHPALTADELAARFVPPARFATVRFDNYVPNPAHPSQAAAVATLEAFGDTLAAPAPPDGGGRFFRRAKATPKAPAGPAALYLDGGYGVGKTHLIAALFHASAGPAAYLTFAELTAVIGFVGMEEAVRAFARYRLLCIDEFELDDVANTLMAVTFLRSVLPSEERPDGTRVATTSNSVPDRLGEGRFAADDFRREIAAIAGHFDVLRIDGPDYRASAATPVESLDEDEVAAVVAGSDGPVSDDDFGGLVDHLRQVHPVQFAALIDGLDTVVLRGLRPLANQGDALLFVHLVDELYDAGVTVAATGCGVHELFPDAYRHGGYRMKYGRAESRLGALLAEATARL